MSQNDMVIADGTGSAVRADVNSALQALASSSTGATAPTTTYPHQVWADTTAGLLKIRNNANTAWMIIAALNETSGQWEPRADVIQALTTAGFTFKNAAGTVIGTLSDSGVFTPASPTVATTTAQGISRFATTAEAQAGTATNISTDPAGVAAAIVALGGRVLQLVYDQNKLFMTSSVYMPSDDTIPQITEGVEVLSASITPKSATSSLIIFCDPVTRATGPTDTIGALFMDGAANAIATAFDGGAAGADYFTAESLLYVLPTPSTASHTFAYRVGTAGYSITINGSNASRVGGGTAVSTMIILEIEP